MANLESRTNTSLFTMGNLLEEFGNLPGFDSLHASGFFDTEELWDISPTVTKVDKVGAEDKLAFEPPLGYGPAGNGKGEKKSRTLKRTSKRRKSVDRKARSESTSQKVGELLAARDHQEQPKKSSLKRQDRYHSTGAIPELRKSSGLGGEGEPNGNDVWHRKKRPSKTTPLARLCEVSTKIKEAGVQAGSTEEPTKVTSLETAPEASAATKKRMSKRSNSGRTSDSSKKKEHRRRSHGHKSSSEAKSKATDAMAASEGTGRQRLMSRKSDANLSSTNALTSIVQSAIPDSTEITSLSIAETGPNRLKLTVKYSSAKNLMAEEQKQSSSSGPKLRRRKTTEGRTERRRLHKKSYSERNLTSSKEDTSSKTKRKSSKTSMSASDQGTRTRLSKEDEEGAAKLSKSEPETPRTRRSRIGKMRTHIVEPIQESTHKEPETPKTRKARVSKKRSSSAKHLSIEEAIPALKPIQESGNKDKKEPEVHRPSRKSRLIKKRSSSARNLTADEPAIETTFATEGRSLPKTNLLQNISNSMRCLSSGSDDALSRHSESSPPTQKDQKGPMVKSSSLRDLMIQGKKIGDKAARRMSESSKSRMSASSKPKESRRSSNRRSASHKSLSLDEAFASSAKKTPRMKSSSSVSEGMTRLKEKTNRSTRSAPEKTMRRNSLASSGMRQLEEVKISYASQEVLLTPRTRRKRLAATKMALPSLQSFLDSSSSEHNASDVALKPDQPNTSLHSSGNLSLADTIANSTGVSLASTITNSCGVSLASTIANSTGVSLADTIDESNFSHIDTDDNTMAGFSLGTEVSRISQDKRRRRHSAGHGVGHGALVNSLQHYDQGVTTLASAPYTHKSTDLFAEDAVWVHRRLRAQESGELNADESSSASTISSSTFSDPWRV